MVLALIALLFATPPAAAPAARVSADTAAQEFVTNFVAGRVDAASKDFNDEMRGIVTPAVLAQLRGSVEAEAGAFKSIESMHQLREDGFGVVELTCLYEKHTVVFRIVFDADERIGSLSAKVIVPTPVDPALESAVRDLVADFAAGRFGPASKHFDPALRGQLTPAKLAELAGTIGRRFGQFESVKEVRQFDDGAFRVIDLIAKYQVAPVLVRVAFKSDGAISGVSIGPGV